MTNTLTYELNSAAASEGWIARIRRVIADYRLYRQTLAELEALSPRELRDLGLSRFAIRQVAYDSVYSA
jgi:uncharacterized protein YjiS (DUF1127 family)